MPLTLTVEDGSIVSGANSYASLEVARAWNVQRGTPLPDDDDACIALLTQALDFIEAYEPRFKGDRAQPLLQELSWPRVNAYLFSYAVGAFPSDSIPSKLINAQCYLAGVAQTVDLAAVQDTRAITKEVIGPIETDYDTKSGATLRPIIPQLDSMLASLLNSGVGLLRTLRV